MGSTRCSSTGLRFPGLHLSLLTTPSPQEPLCCSLPCVPFFSSLPDRPPSTWDLPSYPVHTTPSQVLPLSCQCLDIIPKIEWSKCLELESRIPGCWEWSWGSEEPGKKEMYQSHFPSPVSMNTSVSSQPSLSLHTMLLIRSHFQSWRETALKSEDVAS